MYSSPFFQWHYIFAPLQDELHFETALSFLQQEWIAC